MKLYLDSLVNSKSQEGQTRDLKKSFDEISDKFERLSIEHQALKVEKSVDEKRLQKNEETDFSEQRLLTQNRN